MARARFEIDCKRPDAVMDSVRMDDTHPVAFSTAPGMLVIEIEAGTTRDLMKIAYSVCNRVQLSIDTINKFR